jgi:hypothetical protein
LRVKELNKRGLAEELRKAEKKQTANRSFSVLSFPQLLSSPPLSKCSSDE